MSYVLVEDFRYGLDTRKSAITAPPGTLRQLENAHITRGGEIEKAKALSEKYELPEGTTFGLASLLDDLYVFGSASSPGMIPSGVTYQRLAHPDSASINMTEVLSVEIFDSKLYVVAKFENDDIFHYYDGALATDWGAGLVRSGMTDNAGIAAHLAALIDEDAAVSATSLSNVVTVTAADAGTAFTITATAENKTGGTDDQTAVVATPTPSVAGVPETLASCNFTITGGSANTAATGSVTLDTGASGSVDSITVNGVNIMSAPVAFNTDLPTTASDVASNINAHTSSPDYTAVAVGSVITISGTQAAGADPNGFVVVSSCTTITATDANMAGGVTNAITSVKVDGIEVLGARVNWSSSHSTLAANTAAQIQSYTSSPNYDSTSANAQVTIKGVAGSGATPNGKTVAVTVAGSVEVSVPSPAMDGGVAAVSGQAQVSTITIGGTFEAGDKFTATINGYPYGWTSRPQAKGTTLLTLKKKLYSGVGANLHFSAIGLPAKQSTSDTGAGFINMSNEAPKFEEITALASYFNDLVIFAKRVIQTWTMNADPTQNAQSQIIPNMGTFAPKSVVGVGEGDVIFLARNGIRALKPRDSSNFASVSEIGTAIDEEVGALIKTLTEEQKRKVAGTVEPLDNRYWLAIATRIYVFSFFSGSKVSAWSQYEPGLPFTDFAVIDDFLYARSGDKVYLYGGDDGDEYVGADAAVITLPFLDTKSPAAEKELEGMDVALEGYWKVEIATDPSQPTVFDEVMRVASQTYTMQKIPVEGKSTHFAVRFTSLDDGYGKIGNLAIHYRGGEAG